MNQEKRKNVVLAAIFCGVVFIICELKIILTILQQFGESFPTMLFYPVPVSKNNIGRSYRENDLHPFDPVQYDLVQNGTSGDNRHLYPRLHRL